MRCSSHQLIAALLAVLALPPTLLRGDALLIQSGTGNPIQLGDVKITGIQDGVLQFTAAAGRQTSKPLEQVPQITLDDEPTFSPPRNRSTPGNLARRSRTT